MHIVEEVAPPAATPGYRAFLAFIGSTFSDPELMELLINPSGAVTLVGATGRRPGPCFQLPDAQLQEVIQEWVFYRGGRLDPLLPCAGGAWGDGWGRWHAVIPPMVASGVLFSLRRHRFDEVSLDNSYGQSSLLHALRQSDPGIPTVIYGDTGAGKTTLAVALLREWGASERIAVLEHEPEFPVQTTDWLLLRTCVQRADGFGGVGMEDLLASALRLRPDRIVIAEIRQHEAMTFLQALHVGHGGVVTTMHAADADSVIRRLELLIGRSRLRRALEGRDLRLVGLRRGTPPVIASVDEYFVAQGAWQTKQPAPSHAATS